VRVLVYGCFGHWYCVGLAHPERTLRTLFMLSRRETRIPAGSLITQDRVSKVGAQTMATRTRTLVLLAVTCSLVGVVPQGWAVPVVATGVGPAGGGTASANATGASLLAAAYSSIEAGRGPASANSGLNGSWTNSYGPPGGNLLSDMVYDAADGYVVLIEQAAVGGPAVERTWTFSHDRWDQLESAGGPPFGYGVPITYDARDGYVLEYGGGCGYCNDTWIFKGGTWTNITKNVTNSPPSRGQEELAYDSHDQYVVLYGGFGTVNGKGAYLQDTWTYRAGVWKEIHPKTHPLPLTQGMLVNDPAGHDLVLFGGASPKLRNETWTFSGGVWTNVTNFSAPTPMARAAFGMDYDPNVGGVLLYGGDGGVLPHGFLGDTWEFVGGAWKELAPIVSPGHLAWVALSYDPTDSQTILFGGVSNGSANGNITWSFKAGTWTQVGVESPPRRFLPALTYDSKDHYVVLFGGAFGSTPRSDTWEFSSAGWTRLHPSVSPSARFGAAMAYDAADGYVLLFGGCAVGDSPLSCPHALNDTWTFAGGVWKNITPTVTTSPSSRYGSTISYDGRDGYVVLFGGCGSSGSRCFLNDTWTFSNGQWIESRPSQAPPGRVYAGAAYDPNTTSVVMFGGCGNLTCPLGDTWTFSQGNWTQASPAHSPPATEGASVQFDMRDGYLLMEGGSVACGTSKCLDNASWEFSAGTWTRLVPDQSPLSSTFQGSAYDSISNDTILFGGCAKISCTSSLNQTWSWVLV